MGNPQKLGGRPGTDCPSEPPEGTSLARHLDLRLPSASVVTPQMSVSVLWLHQIMKAFCRREGVLDVQRTPEATVPLAE